MTGGGALNIITNQQVRSRYPQIPVYVPVAPADSGLSIGAVYAASPPPFNATGQPEEQQLGYLGPALFDLDEVPELVLRYKAVPITLEEMGRDLVKEEAVIALLLGRMEVTHQSLGHRSILAFPKSVETKKRVNELKHNEWWQGCASMVQEDKADEIFNPACIGPSPYLGFCPRVKPGIWDSLGGVMHHDLTTNVHTVTEKDEPNLYKLLSVVKEHGGQLLSFALLSRCVCPV